MNAKLDVAASILLAMALFHGNSPQSIFGAPRLTVIMYAGTAAVSVIAWVLLSVARVLGVDGDSLVKAS